jgi:hypothetical protein
MQLVYVHTAGMQPLDDTALILCCRWSWCCMAATAPSCHHPVGPMSQSGTHSKSWRQLRRLWGVGQYAGHSEVCVSMPVQLVTVNFMHAVPCLRGAHCGTVQGCGTALFGQVRLHFTAERALKLTCLSSRPFGGFYKDVRVLCVVICCLTAAAAAAAVAAAAAAVLPHVACGCSEHRPPTHQP